MSRLGTIAVQHCILATVTKRHGTRPVFDLLEVAYEYTVPADTEFPKFVSKLDLFLRVLARSAGPTQLRIRVYRRRRRRQWERVNDFFSPNRVLSFPRNRTVVLSDSFRLPNVKLTGTGLYAVRVFFRPPRSRWQLGAAEYFRVVR
jgi:hypothetical protein